MTGALWASLTLTYHLASRLAYVLYIAFALKREEKHGYLTARHGAEAGFRRFRRVASSLMNNDGASFVLLCVVTRHTLGPGLERPGAIAAGAVLVLLGVGVKLWAAATLGARAYYWYNFFVATGPVAPSTSGPYRFLKNPMYTVGYLQTYGLALVLGSLPGLLAAAFDQSAVLAFHRWVEQPHFERLAVATTPRSRP